MAYTFANWINLKYYPKNLERNQEKLPRSSSIDSMVDVVWNNENDANLVTLPKLLMVQETTSRRESLLSPRRTKQSRGINCKIIELNLIMENIEKKQFNIHEHCKLFTSRENEHFLQIWNVTEELRWEKKSFRLQTFLSCSVYE